MASQHINAWSKSEQISLTLRDGISPWYSPQPTSTRCRTKVWKKKKMNWSFDSCCKMFVCNFCENSCSLSGQDNVKSVFSSASFTETRNCQHIFEITEDFFYFVIFTPRKKETWHVLEVSHDRSLGVWCKGICKYDQSFRQEWSVTISRDLMVHGFQGIWREHLADLCGTVRLRSADDVAQSRSLRRGVAFPWRTGGLVIGLIRFVLSVVKYKQLSSYTDYNRICKR